MRRVWLLWILLVVGAQASTNMWVRTGEAYGIEPRLLYAISKVESDHRPLVISVNFKKLTKFQLDKLCLTLKSQNIPYNIFTKVVEINSKNTLQAKYVINFLDKNNYPSFDIGMMQINNIHKGMLSKMNISLYQLLNEETNLKVASGILWDCYKKHRSNQNAINAYNGKLNDNPYYSKVSAVLHNLLLPHENDSKRLFYRIL